MTEESIAARDAIPSELVGTSVQRREDPHLLTGESEYTDDIHYPGEVHLALLGSQYGHARIVDIDTSEAAAADGVLAVYTQTDVTASGVPGLLRVDNPENGVTPDQPMLADGRVRYQGQPVAAVVAEDRYAAHDALSLVDVEYDRLDAVVDPVEALSGNAPTIHDEAPDNRAFEWELGDDDAVERAFADADRVVELDLEINRIIPTAMEPRAAVARYRPSTGELSVELSAQNPHTVKADLSWSLDVPDHKIRVRPPDVGGGFGAKLQAYTGNVMAGWCAMQLERPVKWVATRTEDSAAMVHSRHQVVEAAAAVDDDGELCGIRATSVAPVGGFMVPGGSGVPKNMAVTANGQYDVPAVHVEITGAFTNTTPLGAYRGAGRPESTYLVERLVRAAAGELGMDPVAFRRKNLIPTVAFPYDNGLGRTYDSGDYDRSLDALLDAIDYDDLRDRQAALREEGRYLGVGLSCFVESVGSSRDTHETGTVQVHPSGKVVVKSGTTEIGTGHRTAYTQIVANRLGVPMDDVEVVEGDTAHVVEGMGTSGSRSMPVGGSAVYGSADELRQKATRIAGHLLEATAEDVVVDDGTFHIRGVPGRSVSLAEVARAAYSRDHPPDESPGLEATTYYDPSRHTFPFGSHAAVVEVDPSSGEVDLRRYYGVTDVGVQINPKLVDGQVHGGVVQGIGQALFEHVVYDDNGTLLTGSFQDYALPKAFDLPTLETDSTVTPCPHNPLGVKGVGEAGAIAAPPAVVNAVVDALEPLGVTHVDMPMTSETVWQAVQDVR